MDMKQVLQLSVTSIAVALGLSACSGNAAEQSEQRTPLVAVTTVITSPLEITEDYPGRVAAVRTADIRAQVSGIVQRRLFQQGTDIKAGQPLFQINPAPFQADVDTAAATLKRSEAVLARAQIQVLRLRPLMQTDAISQQSYDDAVSQRDQAEAEVAQARATLARRKLDLKFATIDSPISGRIEQAQMTEGALVTPTDSTPLAKVQQIDQVYVDVRQPASSFDALRSTYAAEHPTKQSNAPIMILRSDDRAVAQKGRILFSGVSVDPGTGDALVRVLVDNNKRELLPGMYVRARLPKFSYNNALQIPEQAVVRLGGKPQVWVMGPDHKVFATNVVLGELVHGYYRVRDGLKSGEKIVVEGQERLSLGIEVASQAWRPTANEGRKLSRDGI
ncbi:efflux RND transporter periplasmic adaptor subunit [Chitinimonas sp.]|uniref:efflux RND transporter periplasmic adaptor subunit n=1 Tax=Chitinimonas sp. TaxID=1934313 RepID=UPI002F92CCF9